MITVLFLGMLGGRCTYYIDNNVSMSVVITQSLMSFDSKCNGIKFW